MSQYERVLDPRYYPLGVEDVAQLYNMKENTVRELARKNAIPHVRIQHRLRFNEKEVAEAMIKTRDEAPTGWENVTSKGCVARTTRVDERDTSADGVSTNDILGDI